MPNQYKHAFVKFVLSIEWDWFITIPVGHCPPDDEVIWRLRRIEAELNKRYVATRYHKVSVGNLFQMAIAFEGERECGTRHAHVLVRIPNGKTRRVSRTMVVGMFPFEFRFLWHSLGDTPALWESKHRMFPWEPATEDAPLLRICPANYARSVYTVKDVRQADVPWSRFEFVTPARVKTFNNENLKAIKHRDHQKRLVLGLR